MYLVAFGFIGSKT
jgi:hypothetical protein